MKPLLTLTPREEALERLKAALLPVTVEQEWIDVQDALGRILAEDITAPHPLPHFARSTMDGYAARAADTVGATESLPAYLRVIGELPMGRAPELRIGAGEAALIHTGGALPEGADAVVILERTQEAGSYEIEVLRAVAPGENVIPVGEDVRTGDSVLKAGCRLRPQELGGLAALGITHVHVARRPRVALISTGDELVPPEVMPGLNQVRDLNSTAIGALVEEQGGIPLRYGIIRDDAEVLYTAASRGMAEADMVIITAGSSLSVRDMTADVIGRLGKPGVLVHGVPLKPGKPTILAVCDGKPVFGLPGNPVSALNTARIFVVPTLWYLQGAEPSRRGVVHARLAENVPAASGREFFASVRLEERADGVWAVPVFGESNLIFTLVRGVGVVHVPLGATGLPQGAEVDVMLF
ncbi:MAG: molybdopterin molybdotransferase MoeA [Anaerolineae bacterium]|jgi:molybdopterin molybdotransferase|nr:molybdopterin molybdotransferase MoeA [Anaerolineae bacterium]